MRLKGVIWAGTSPGSNHDGAMVTCQAQTSSPAARVWAPARGVRTMVRAAPTSKHTTRDANRIILPLPQTMTSVFETDATGIVGVSAGRQAQWLFSPATTASSL